MSPSKMKIVYVVTSRGDKSYWNRIGVAFVNRDGSINAKLDAVPVSGSLQIRDYSPRDDDTDINFASDGNGASDDLAQLA